MTFILCAILGLWAIDLPTVSETDPSPDTRYKKASQHLDHGEYRKAILDLLALEKRTDWSKENLRKTYINLGFAYYKLNEFDSSVYFYIKGNEYAAILKDTTKIISSFNSIALAYRQLGQYSRSLDYYQKAHDLALQRTDRDILAQVLTSMGSIHQTLGRKDEALSHHHRSLEFAMVANDSTSIAVAFHNMAIAHKASKSLDSSLFYNLKSLALKRQLGNKPSFVVSTLNNIGTLYLALGDFAEAEKYFWESNLLHKQLKDSAGLFANYNNFGDLALRRNQIKRSLAFLDSGSTLFSRISDLEYKKDHLALRLTGLEKRGDFAKALPVYRELTAINERIFQDEKLKVHEVEASYRISQVSLLRETAEQRASLALAKAKSANQFVILLTIIIVLSLGFGTQLFRLNRMLRVKNEIIRDQKRDNEHRIYNFLSRLQGLLRLASANVSDQTSKGILQNSEAAIISAAALQEHLTYTDMENEKMLVGQYLQGLTVRLRELFLLTGDNAKLELTVKEDVRLPVQTVMNIGLIVSEIVTNSMKYAFPAGTYEPSVGITVQKTGETLSIQVGDNGIGISNRQIKGMGSGLIQRLAKYIKAELTEVSGPGTQYKIALKVVG
jgi:two-component sensor histidine kinase